jgi:hypothetical protein
MADNPPKEFPFSLEDKFVSNEFSALVPLLSETMMFAAQAIAQSSALAQVLVEKGIVTKEEVDKRMSSTQEARKKLMDLLDESLRKIS